MKWKKILQSKFRLFKLKKEANWDAALNSKNSDAFALKKLLRNKKKIVENTDYK